MVDINGVIIEAGQTVKTQQPAGGILSPAPPTIGIVEEIQEQHRVKWGHKFQIRYRKEGQDFDSFILLHGKINEVIEQ